MRRKKTAPRRWNTSTLVNAVTRHQWLMTAATGSMADTWLPTRSAAPRWMCSSPETRTRQRTRKARMAAIVIQ
jgi:hypothetical protein